MRAQLFFLACSAITLGGCFASSGGGGDRCEAEQQCFAIDSFGCCGGDSTRVSVCDSCPAGTAPRTDCRATGCETTCEVPLNCRMDMGAGCCGDAVFTESCDTCPPGSVEASSCTASDRECACGLIGPIRPPDPEPVPLPSCYADLGGGCCGDIVGNEDPTCGCPVGSVPEAACRFPGGDFFPGPVASCREDFGGGCCGSVVEPNGCGFCPTGSVDESACAATRSEIDGGDREADPMPPGDEPAPPDDPADPPGAGAPAPPAEPPSCYMDLGGGCCGEPIWELNACGECPTGYTLFCDRFDC